MPIRFVRPETAVLTLSGGDTLIVKKRLTSGEHRARLARSYTADDHGDLHLNFFETGVALITAYLIDWTMSGDEAVPIRGLSIEDLTSVLNNLDSVSFTEIKTAIEAHERAQDAALADEKKTTRDGAMNGSPISASPFAAAGASSGSARSIRMTT